MNMRIFFFATFVIITLVLCQFLYTTTTTPQHLIVSIPSRQAGRQLAKKCYYNYCAYIKKRICDGMMTQNK